MSELKERYEKVQTRKYEALTRAKKMVAELGKSFLVDLNHSKSKL